MFLLFWSEREAGDKLMSDKGSVRGGGGYVGSVFVTRTRDVRTNLIIYIPENSHKQSYVAVYTQTKRERAESSRTEKHAYTTLIMDV